jgi:hypothetical protein
MPIFLPIYKDPKTGEIKQSNIYWYDFRFLGKRVRESAKTTSKTLARQAEKNRRRELEEGINGLVDNRDDRMGTRSEQATSLSRCWRMQRHRPAHRRQRAATLETCECFLTRKIVHEVFDVLGGNLKLMMDEADRLARMVDRHADHPRK